MATHLTKITKTLFHLGLPVSDSLPQTLAQHLGWIMQKDILGQDVFLIGPPGPLRRSIAMQYLVSTHIKHTHVCEVVEKMLHSNHKRHFLRNLHFLLEM